MALHRYQHAKYAEYMHKICRHMQKYEVISQMCFKTAKNVHKNMPLDGLQYAKYADIMQKKCMNMKKKCRKYTETCTRCMSPCNLPLC